MYTKTGLVRPEQVAEAIREDTCLVTGHVRPTTRSAPSSPSQEIGGYLPRERACCFHTDAVQAAGHLPDGCERSSSIDMLIPVRPQIPRARRESGPWYATRGIIPATIDYRTASARERGRRAGTENVPAIVGMAAALEEASSGHGRARRNMAALRDRLTPGACDQIPHHGAERRCTKQRRCPAT